MAFLKEHSIFKRDIYEKHVFHSSPRRLAGEKKATAIIIKQQFGFLVIIFFSKNFMTDF